MGDNKDTPDPGREKTGNRLIGLEFPKGKIVFVFADRKRISLPRNPITLLIASYLVLALVIGQIHHLIASAIDKILGAIYELTLVVTKFSWQSPNGPISPITSRLASKSTGEILKNIKRLLVILVLLLFILDSLGMINMIEISSWPIPI